LKYKSSDTKNYNTKN